MNSITPTFAGVISNFLGQSLAEEGLTPEVLACVDLAVACRPVLIYAGEGRPSHDVTPLEDGRYLLRDTPDGPRIVAAEELRIMRARYLLARNGPPPANPQPIITIDTTTPEGHAEARELLLTVVEGASCPVPPLFDPALVRELRLATGYLGHCYAQRQARHPEHTEADLLAWLFDREIVTTPEYLADYRLRLAQTIPPS